MITKDKVKELTKISASMRLDLLQMFSYGKAHHFGGSLSCVEMVTALYFYKMKLSRSDSEERDRFIMSKGHTVPTQYVALSLLGVIPKQELSTIKKLGTRLQGHPDMRKTPGIEAPTGSLGMGLSFGNGIALSGRRRDLKYNVFVVMGDGEMQEGQVWEAAMTTAHYGLGNICVLVDHNRFQSQGAVNGVMNVDPLAEKFRAFGWDAINCNGHDIEGLCKILDGFPTTNDKPLAIVCDTLKGKGIGFMQNTHAYHNASLTEEQYHAAESELHKLMGEE